MKEKNIDNGIGINSMKNTQQWRNFSLKRRLKKKKTKVIVIFRGNDQIN